jgi:hypothetical protein
VLTSGKTRDKLLDVMLLWCVRPADAGLSVRCAANAIARLDVANAAASALGKRFLGTDTRAPATTHKSTSKNNVLQRSKKRSSLFANTPLNILGGGSWRWPDTPQIDRQKSATIVRAEIGSLVVSAGETANTGTKN